MCRGRNLLRIRQRLPDEVAAAKKFPYKTETVTRRKMVITITITIAHTKEKLNFARRFATLISIFRGRQNNFSNRKGPWDLDIRERPFYGGW